MQESTFAKRFTEIKPDFGLGQDFELVRELETQAGIPDSLGISCKDVKTLLDFMSKYPDINLTNGYSQIISQLYPRNFVEIDQIFSKTDLSKSYFDRHIQLLENKDLIERDIRNDSRIRLGENFSIPELDIWTIEFKMSAWKSALKQAIRYRLFSSKVFVVMPSTKLEFVKKKEGIFKKFGIGLAFFDSAKGDLDIEVPPRKNVANAKSYYIDVIGRLSQSDKINFR
ncbi:MAG: hypothetical protein ABEI53_02975 [Candidatus Magasanikbacteria bacterium]